MRTTYLLQEKQLDGSTCLVETTAENWHAIVQACAKLPTDQRRYFIRDVIPDDKGVDCMDQRNFQAVEGNRRRPGTGCLHQIGDHLWEGRYSRRDENGKRMAKNVYAKTKEECEVKLQGLIAEMKDQVRLEEKQKEQIALTM